MSHITIYHNPRCSKSRQTLKLLRDSGHEPKVVLTLEDPPDVTTLRKLVDLLGIEPRDLIRRKEYRALELPETDDPDELVCRMAEHPSIIERPIVVAGNRARLGRPPEQVLEIL